MSPVRSGVESAIRSVLARSGRGSTIDPDLSATDLASIAGHRYVELLRGRIRFRQNVFCGKRVQVSRRRTLELGTYSAIGDYSKIDSISRLGVRLGPGAKLGRYVTVTGTSSIATMGVGLHLGANSAIGDFGHIGCAGGVFLGDDVIVGPLVTFHSQEHRTTDAATPIRRQGTVETAIHIESDVWVGARVTFLAGARVGAHSVVAAGAVVRGEFPEYSVIGGVPARVLRARVTTPTPEEK